MRKSLGLFVAFAATMLFAGAQPAAANHIPGQPYSPPWGYVSGSDDAPRAYPYDFIFSAELTDPLSGGGGFEFSPSRNQFAGGDASCLSIQGSKATLGFWSEERGSGVMLTVFDAEADPAHNLERYPELYFPEEGFYDMFSDLVIVDSPPTDCHRLFPLSFPIFHSVPPPGDDVQVHMPPAFKSGPARCRAEEEEYKAARFRRVYGGGSNAFGKCASGGKTARSAAP